MYLKFVCLVACLVFVCDCANILAILPCPSYSHQIAYTHLWKELSLRGHKVTLITTDPLNDPKLTNLTEIDMKWSYKFIGNISQMTEQDELTMWTFHKGILELMKVDVNKFLGRGTEGCIYVSLGSNVKSSQLSQRLLKPILDALAEVPYKVLWKFETDAFDMPQNIKVAKWLPQQKVLNHPNVKLFLTQGGLQSMEEAIYGEVPFVIIPFFSDQYQNARILENKGVAIVLDRKSLNKHDLKKSMLKVMREPKYRNGVKQLKKLILDEPMTGLEKAVWWTEYVIRNKGAKHLRNPAADLPFYQYYLLDVIGFVLVVIILIITMIVLVLSWLCKLRVVLRSRKSIKEKTQ